MKNKNFLSKLCSPSVGSQSSDVSLDRRLTVGSPSGFHRSVVLKLCTVLVVLLTIGVGQMWGSEITLVATDFATNNGYFTSEQTFTKTVQFGYIYAYQSNANNTPTGWAKNQAVPMKGHASQNGKIYNKAAISTISNIRVYVVANTNSFTVSYGTTTACDAGSITRPATATGTQSITYTSYNSGSKTTTTGQSTTATYYDFDLSAANPTYFKISNGSSVLYIWKIVITYSSGTSVSLTKAGQTNGSFKLRSGSCSGSELSGTPPTVTTTSSAQTVYIDPTPNNGYQVSSVTSKLGDAAAVNVSKSGDCYPVTYAKDASGTAVITVTFSCVTPSITVHPASKTDYTVGDVATALSVAASANNASLGYQWQVSNNNSDWSDIAAGDGGTAETYTPSTAAAGTKYYRVIVSNAATGCSTTATSNAATITVAAAAYFPNSKTLFIEAGKDGSAWDASACVKAWFRDGDAGGEVVATQWLANSADGKKIFATVIPSTGSYRYMTIQRFTEGCVSFWNDNGAVSKVDDGGSNVVKTTCSTNTCVSWSPSALSLYLRGSDNWLENLATLSDQNDGIWTATYSNYAATATSREYRITDSYSNSHGSGNTTLSGMKVGSTYNITASYDVTSGTLTMSKTFVKGEVSFDLQGHGSAISDLENVTAGSKISAPSTPTDASYIFGGWYKEAGCVNAWDFANDVVNESMTLYAKWYQVTLVVKDEAGTTLSGDGKPTLTRSGASLTAAEAGNYAFKTIAITSGTGTLSAVSSSTTIATISSDITVTATFWNARTITKGTGTGTSTFTVSPTGEVKYGSSVTVTCAATDGYKNPWTLTVTPSDGATYDETGSTGSITISNITKNITVDLAYTDKGCTTHKGNDVDEGSSYSNVYGPVNDNWKYGARQILYTKSDLGLAAGKKGTIKSISFQYQYSTAISDKDKVKIYMANTNLTSLSTSNYVTSFTEVYSGSMNCSNGWNEIELNTDFDYNGVGNLLVVIEDYSGKYTGSSYAFYYHEATTGIQLYNTTDGSAYDITAASTWTGGTAVAYRPNTKFCIEEDDMVKATVNWYVNGSIEHTQTDYPGTALTSIPTPDSEDCDGEKEFVGWYTDDYTHASVAPAFVNPTVIPEGGADYYAVFATVTPTNNYQQITSEGDLVAGAKYVIVGNSATTYNALPVDAATSLSSVSPSGTPLTISSPGSTLIWTLEGSADAWKIKSTSNSKYIQISDGSLSFVNSTSLTFSVGVSSNIFTFTSSAASGNKILSYYHGGKPSQFNAYTSPNNVYVFKQVVNATNYATTCATTYDVTRAGTPAGTVTGGTFTVSPNRQAAGKTVTLSATPDLGYAFGSWTVTKTESPYTDISSTNVAGNTLTMPAYGVTVNASFTPTPELTATGGNLDGTTLPFGTSCEQDEGTDKTFVLNGYSLTNNVTLTIGGTDASMFTVKSPSSPIDKGTGRINDQTVTITFTPTSTGAKTATLTISSTGATSKTITLSGTAVKHYKVHYWNSGEDVHQESVLAGADATATWDGVGDGDGCDAVTYRYFIGWSKTNIGSTPTSTKPTMGGTYSSLSADVHYYAVWSNVNPGGWERYENATIAEGDYLVVEKIGDYYRTMKNSMTGTRMNEGVAKFSGSLITDPTNELTYDWADYIWHIAKPDPDEAEYTFYNADESKYVVSTGTASQVDFVASPSNGKELFTYTYNSTYKTYNWTNKYNSTNSVNATFRNAGSGFSCYASDTHSQYLYYRPGGTAMYKTTCCEYNVTLADGSPSHGSITFDPAGPVETCSGSKNVTMTITPDAGYYLSDYDHSGVNTSNSPTIATSGSTSEAAQDVTLTFAQNTTSGTYTADATFSQIMVSSLNLRVQQTGQDDKVGNDLIMTCYPKEGQTGGNDPLSHSLNVAFASVLPANALDKTYDWSVRVKATGDADWTDVGFTGNSLNTNSLINTFTKSTGLLKIGNNTGTAEIKITANDGSGVFAKVTITIASVSMTGVSVDPTSMEVYAGEKKPVAITFEPANATTRTYSTGSYSYVTIRSSGSNPFYIEGKSTNVVRNETVTVTTTDGSFTATIDVTVNPLPQVTFLDIVHNKTDFTTDGDDLPASGIIASTASEGVVTHSKKTPTRAADVTDPGVGRNTCEREHLHLIGWIRNDYDKVEDYLNGTGSQLTITQIISAGNDGSGHAYFLAPDVSIDVRDYEGKTFYAVWAKIE